MVESKIVLVRPYDEDMDFSDGEIVYFGEMSKYYYHAGLLCDYGLKVYGEDSIFGIIKECQMPSVFAYFLAEYYGYVVFLNLHYELSRKKGVMYLPSDISFSQMESVNHLFSELNGFEIEVNRDLEFIDGFTYSTRDVVISDGDNYIYNINKKNKGCV